MNLPFNLSIKNEFGLVEFFVSIIFSLLMGIAVMLLYRLYFNKVLDRNDSLAKSFVILSPSVTAIFWAIQYSLPLSLGLLGALSFVRFRSPIKKAEDIGFILLVIALSLLSSIYRFESAALLLLIIIIIIMFKYIIIEKKLTSLKLGTHLVIFISTISKDVEEINKTIRDALIQNIEYLKNNKLILTDVVPKNNLYTLQYSAFFDNYDENTITKIISNIEKIDNIERVEVFRGKIEY